MKLKYVVVRPATLTTSIWTPLFRLTQFLSFSLLYNLYQLMFYDCHDVTLLDGTIDNLFKVMVSLDSPSSRFNPPPSTMQWIDTYVASLSILQCDHYSHLECVPSGHQYTTASSLVVAIPCNVHVPLLWNPCQWRFFPCYAFITQPALVNRIR